MIAVRMTPGAVYLRRPVLVAARLDDLRGPAGGVVELPLHLFWSAADGSFSLDDPVERLQVYRIVLREARRPGDLADFLNGGTLVAVWPDILLPRLVRKAWEDQHLALRDTRFPGRRPPVAVIPAELSPPCLGSASARPGRNAS